MSEEQSGQSEPSEQSFPVITSQEKPKEKDPRKVAAGKRLGAISKAAKEEKRKRREAELSESHLKQYAIIALGLGVLGYAGYKYFFGKVEKDHKTVHVEAQTPDAKRGEAEKKKETKRGKPISMFD